MNDTQHPAASPDPAAEKTAADGARFSSRRRRLLKIAGGAAPASLLLVGRPVHATYTCNSTSAWGSAQLSAAQSVRLGKGTAVEGYSLEMWRQSDSPWTALKTKMGDNTNFANWKSSVTVGACVGAAPSGLTGKTPEGSPLFDALNAINKCAGSSDFGRLMLVALLNHKIYPSRTTCVSEIDLKEMATGIYRFSPTVTWDKTRILEYVETNKLARRQ